MAPNTNANAEQGMYARLWDIYKAQNTPAFQMAAVMRKQIVADAVADLETASAPANDDASTSAESESVSE